MKPFDKAQTKNVYTDKEINEVAEWFQSLSFEEILLLKQLDESVKQEAIACVEGAYVH